MTGFDAEPEGNYYCLVESTGPANEADPRSTGFGLYLGPQDPTNPVGPYFWQVWMGDGTQFSQVAVGAQPVDAAQSVLTYLALTFLGNNNSVNDGQGNDLNFNLALYLYRPDTNQDLTVPSLQALSAAVNTFKPNTVANSGGGDFFICSGSNLFPAAPPSFVQVGVGYPGSFRTNHHSDIRRPASGGQLQHCGGRMEGPERVGAVGDGQRWQQLHPGGRSSNRNPASAVYLFRLRY